MSEVVSIYAAKTRLSELVAKAEAGAEIIIARGKKPVARLVPLSELNILKSDSETRKKYEAPEDAIVSRADLRAN